MSHWVSVDRGIDFFFKSYEPVLSNLLKVLITYKTKDFIKVILRDITGVSKFGA